MKKRELIRSLVFLLLFISLLLSAVLVFDRKTACDYTTRVRGFYNEPEDSMDVLLFGSSHMYCTISPLVLWEETGLRSYVLATQQQPLAASYYYMKESLELQKPRVLVLEVSMAPHGPDSIAEGTVRDCLDPLPWSRNKLELIKQLVPEGERSSYYFNFLKYHSRWKELSARDLDFSYLGGRDLFRGYIYLTPSGALTAGNWIIPIFRPCRCRRKISGCWMISGRWPMRTESGSCSWPPPTRRQRARPDI